MYGKTNYEYVWLDGSAEPSIRSKVRVERGAPDNAPLWGFDGSSTNQAEGIDSDCLLSPVKEYTNPFNNPNSGYPDNKLVLCEVLNPDGTAHNTNARNILNSNSSQHLKNQDWWFGFEQEYVLVDPITERPLGFPEEGYPKPQGDFYCGVGVENVAGREIVDMHLEYCWDAGIEITGTNAEVMIGQWEYQCFGHGLDAADDLWMSRYILYKIAEKYNTAVTLHPKPVLGDWNGSGMHTNFSTGKMRDNGGKKLIKDICNALDKNHKEHIKVYGSNNDLRLTGLHETQHIDEFTWGDSDRGASVRVPVHTINNNYNGYLEDRRPGSNADPYKIVGALVKTLQSCRV
jgi:glutamine synthetase